MDIRGHACATATLLYGFEFLISVPLRISAANPFFYQKAILSGIRPVCFVRYVPGPYQPPLFCHIY
jgi:hypothetical protein